MSIYGFGAHYDEDKSQEFISNGVVCVGYNIGDAPAFHQILRYLKPGDIVYLKSFPPGKGLTIKATGIVTDEEVSDYGNLGMGRRVLYTWTGEVSLSNIPDKYNVRRITAYEEFNHEVQILVIDTLLGGHQQTRS